MFMLEFIFTRIKNRFVQSQLNALMLQHFCNQFENIQNCVFLLYLINIFFVIIRIDYYC